jgi:hypothetical protein
VVTIAYAEDALVRVPTNDQGRLTGVIEPKLHVVPQYAWRGPAHRVLYPVVLSLVQRSVAVSDGGGRRDGPGLGSGGVRGRGAGPTGSDAIRLHGGEQVEAGVRLSGGGRCGKSESARGVGCGTSDEDTGILRQGRAGSREDTTNLMYELMRQVEAAEYELLANQVTRWSVPASKGHDDLLNALVLCVQAGPLLGRGSRLAVPVAGSGLLTM